MMQVVAISVATFAGMATVVGTFNRWPAHEAIGSAAVFIIFSAIAVVSGRMAKKDGERR